MSAPSADELFAKVAEIKAAEPDNRCTVAPSKYLEQRAFRRALSDADTPCEVFYGSACGRGSTTRTAGWGATR